MTRLLFIIGTLAALAVPGVPLTAVYIDKSLSRDVTLISPADEGISEMEREDWRDRRAKVPEKDLAAWTKANPVAPLYGQVVDKPIRVVKPDPAFTIVPPEDPSLTLLKVGSSYHPLQLQTVGYFAKWCTVANVAVAIVCLLAAMVRSRKRPVAPAAA
jgi:hypothetical protein